MNKKATKSNVTPKISSQALRQFAENRRIFNKAVEKAIEENKKAGIPEGQLYSH
jgi:plasmid rolling circle replication initiator protein Rep